jgi:hypothetical protein
VFGATGWRVLVCGMLLLIGIMIVRCLIPMCLAYQLGPRLGTVHLYLYTCTGLNTGCVQAATPLVAGWCWCSVALSPSLKTAFDALRKCTVCFCKSFAVPGWRLQKQQNASSRVRNVFRHRAKP